MDMCFVRKVFNVYRLLFTRENVEVCRSRGNGRFWPVNKIEEMLTCVPLNLREWCGKHQIRLNWVNRVVTVKPRHCKLVVPEHLSASAQCGLAGKLEPMSRDPFQLSCDKKDQHSEFGYGAGVFPDPLIDYSQGGQRSHIPVADPTGRDQIRQLMEIKGMDVADPNDVPSPYVKGNTDRFGARPPLVRERHVPPNERRPFYTRQRMERAE